MSSEKMKKMRDGYVTAREAIAANEAMDCVFALIDLLREQTEYERARPPILGHSPPLPPSCNHLTTWTTVYELRGAFIRLRGALDRHKDALDEQVSEAEMLKAEGLAEYLEKRQRNQESKS